MSKKNKKLKKFKNKTGENINDVQHNEDYIKDKSPYVYQKNKLKTPLNIRIRPDLTDNQKKLIDLIIDKETKMIFISGAAGTSKSYIAIMAALKLLNDKKVSDIIYIRSAVESSERSLGALPGTIAEKINSFLLPMNDKLEELLPKNEIDMLKKEERIIGMPNTHLRGASWSCKAIIADECQDMSYRELYTLCTRISEFSKLIILGDPDQIDIKNSGFEKMISMLDDEESRQQGIHVFRFGIEDVVRSGLVKFLLKKLKKY
jgi:phosphate starvation-inducible protein PhoH and related proteins